MRRFRWGLFLFWTGLILMCLAMWLPVILTVIYYLIT